MPPIRRQVTGLLPSISNPPLGADAAALRSTLIEVLQVLRTRQIIALPTYYDTLQTLSPWALLRLEDTNANALSFAGNVIGTYSGTYLQQQASLLSNNAGSSVRFNNGAITLSQQITAPASYTLICRFRASSTATGGLFGFSNAASPSPGTAYDRSLYLDAQGRIVLYNFNGSSYLLITPNDYRDDQTHTLVARMGAGRTTAIFIDGIKVAETNTTGAANYSGNWKIGWAAYLSGSTPVSALANGITMQGVAIVHEALTDAQIATIHSAA